MMPLFITATGTNIGKTYVTSLLIDSFGKRGVNVGAIKPIETGVDATPMDALTLLHALQAQGSNFAKEPEALCAYTFFLPAAPFCADTKQTIRIEKIMEHFYKARSRCDLLLVEGAGGLKVPITKHFYMMDLIKSMKAHALLVTPSHLGCINETELSLQALRDNRIDHTWCVNLYRDTYSFDLHTRPYYNALYPQWWSVQEGLERFADAYLKAQA